MTNRIAKFFKKIFKKVLTFRSKNVTMEWEPKIRDRTDVRSRRFSKKDENCCVHNSSELCTQIQTIKLYKQLGELYKQITKLYEQLSCINK